MRVCVCVCGFLFLPSLQKCLPPVISLPVAASNDDDETQEEEEEEKRLRHSQK